MAPFIVGDGEVCDELIKVDLGEVVSISVCFVPIVDEFGEIGTLGSLGKDIEVEPEVLNEDIIVGHEHHFGEFILLIEDGSAVHAYAFAPLVCTLTLEEACFCVLVTRLDRFSVDSLNDVMYCHVLEGFFVAHGFE